MKFIIEKLEQELRVEISCRSVAEPFVNSNNNVNNPTTIAFCESYAIADERIPQLIKAIQILRDAK